MRRLVLRWVAGASRVGSVNQRSLRGHRESEDKLKGGVDLVK